MAVRLNILYRGSLESCNYDCDYCPFAKKKNSREELQYDQQCIDKFVNWVAQQKRDIGILFTPWGEALIRSYYQSAIHRLSFLEHVKKVAIQTNLSSGLNWLKHVNREKVGLWTTFHPTEIKIDKFIAKCKTLLDMQVKFSVGIVGTKENFKYAEALRQALPSSVYVWVNAYKRIPDYYSEEDVLLLNQIDPHFNLNNSIYKTYNKACFAGESSISIDGEGIVKRCHFIDKAIGNIYKQTLEEILKPSTCSNETCRCYIGYMNLKEINMAKIYGDQVLERIPII